MTADQPQPESFDINNCTRAARQMLALRTDLPVVLLRKHNRAFFRGAHAGKS